MIKRYKKLFFLSFLVVIALGLCVGGLFFENNRIVSTPAKGETVNLLEGAIYNVASSYEIGITEQYFTGEDCFVPKDVVISWDCRGKDADSYILIIGESENLSDACSYKALNKGITLNDLYAGTHYYYQVIANYEDKTVESEVFDFVTADLPRTISIDGVSNTRDIGGYKTTDEKKRVRQGMVYRGAAIDGLSEEAKKTMLETYGIKTDLDLRGQLKKSPLGDSVNFVNVSAPHYAHKNAEHAIFRKQYQEALVTSIRTFADKDNYPIYMHCQIGRDRTGTLAFLINALLGVGEEDLYMDYELSFLSQSGCADFKGEITPSTFLGDHLWSLCNYIDHYKEEGTLSEKTEQFMLDIGITSEEIASIKAIMLEDVES